MKVFSTIAVIVALTAAPCLADTYEHDEYGVNPTLQKVDKDLVPTVNAAKAVGWPEGGAPIPAAGFKVQAFARDLDHPRTLLVLPNGDVLVAETNTPPKPEDSKGIKGFVMKKVMKRAGAGVESANRITLLRDADGDGRAVISRR